MKSIDETKLDVLRRFWKANRRMPTYSEMCRLFGFASKNASFRLAKRLIDEGYVEKDETGHLLPRPERMGLALRGYVQAGFPSPAEEELVDTLSLDDYLVEKPESSFLLQVTGDSMIEAGIHEGDLVIIERGREARSGDIVLACVDNEWTLKTYRKTPRGVELVPANPNYPIIRPEGELTLGGIVRAVMRRY